VALARPARETVVDALPRAEALGQIWPGQTSLGPVQHGFDEEAVAQGRLRACALLGEDPLGTSPLRDGERVTVHAASQALWADSASFLAEASSARGRNSRAPFSRMAPFQFGPP